MNLVDRIKKNEGWRSRVYECPAGKLSIGWGFNIEDTDLPKPVAELWLAILIEQHEQELKQFAWYNKLDPLRQDVMLEVHYNLGHVTFMKFKKMIAALENQKYNEAAKELLDSKAAKQTGSRYTELAAILAEDENMGI